MIIMIVIINDSNDINVSIIIIIINDIVNY